MLHRVFRKVLYNFGKSFIFIQRCYRAGFSVFFLSITPDNSNIETCLSSIRQCLDCIGKQWNLILKNKLHVTKRQSFIDNNIPISISEKQIVAYFLSSVMIRPEI